MMSESVGVENLPKVLGSLPAAKSDRRLILEPKSVDAVLSRIWLAMHQRIRLLYIISG